MARFRIFLIGSSNSIDAEIDARNVVEIEENFLHRRYLKGNIWEPDAAGVCAAFIIPTNRVQMIVEL